METAKAQKSVLTAMAITVAAVYAARLVGSPTDSIRNPGAMIRIYVGGVAATLGLMLLAGPQPEIAKWLAWIIAMSTVLHYGDPVFDKITEITSRTDYTIVNSTGAPVTIPKNDPTGKAPKPNDPKGGGGGGGSGW